MFIRKTLMAATAAALVSAPAWALSGNASSNGAPSTTPVGPPSSTPNNLANPGHLKHEDNDGHHGNGATGKSGPHGKSHKCAPHKVAYVAAGTLVSDSLTKNADGTYSGTVTITVKRFNHHAKPPLATETEKTYTLTNAHLVFVVTDTNNNGAGAEDLKAGDLVALIGKIT